MRDHKKETQDDIIHGNYNDVIEELEVIQTMQEDIFYLDCVTLECIANDSCTNTACIKEQKKLPGILLDHNTGRNTMIV